MTCNNNRGILRCSITVAAKSADADMAPLVRTYDVSDEADRDMMGSAVEHTRRMLGRGQRANINDVMMLYAGYAYATAGCKSRTDGGVKNGLSSLLADSQVMIGVREMAHDVGITVTDASRGETICSLSAVDPIRPDPRRARPERRRLQQQI